jgi:hypothetical protein
MAQLWDEQISDRTISRALKKTRAAKLAREGQISGKLAITRKTVMY